MITRKEIRDPSKLEAKLESFSKTLHPNHFVLLTLKRRLLDLCKVLGDLYEDSDPVLLRKRLERQVSIL